MRVVGQGRVRMKTLGVIAFVLAWTPLQAVAHHSGAMFDREKTLTLVGTVKKYDYESPHTWITLVVVDPKEQGKEVLWGVESYSPLSMSRWGIVPSTLKVGDKVTMHIHPLKDGRNGGSLMDITLASGKHVTLVRPESQ